MKLYDNNLSEKSIQICYIYMLAIFYRPSQKACKDIGNQLTTSA